MKLALMVCVLSASLAFALPDNSAQARPPHQECTWCHVPSVGRPPAREGQKKVAVMQSAVCLSCHDGMTGPELSDVHAVHMGRFPNEPRNCLDCHDPHDHTGSYVQLRGKNGPETEQSAMFGFCRGCHSDH